MPVWASTALSIALALMEQADELITAIRSALSLAQNREVDEVIAKHRKARAEQLAKDRASE